MSSPGRTWKELAVARFAPVWTHMPAPARAVSEAAFVVAAVLAPTAVELLASLGRPWLVIGLVLTALAAWGVQLQRSSPHFRQQRAWARLAQLGALLGALAAGVIVPSQLLGSTARPQRARLGVELADGGRSEGGRGWAAGGAALVQRVVADSAADGLLEPGDRIVAIAGQPLAEKSPAQDLVQRLTGPDALAAGPTGLLVVRGRQQLEVQVELPPLSATEPTATTLFGSRALIGLSVRNLAVVLLVAMLLLANRQGMAQLGLPRQELGREALLGGAVLGGAFVVHLAVSATVGMVVAFTSPASLGAEAQQRLEVVTDLVSSTPLPSFALVVLLAASFEEVVFRGFVLPRVKQVFRSWAAPLLIVSLLFGLGHAYEGALAVLQTAALGLYFGLVFLWRGRLLSVIVAHAAFNTVMVSLALWLSRSGVLERAAPLLPR